MDCIYRDRCSDYDPNKPLCKIGILSLKEMECCSHYKHFDRSLWNSFEPYIPEENRDSDW